MRLFPEGCVSPYADARYLCSKMNNVADVTTLKKILFAAPESENIKQWKEDVSNSGLETDLIAQQLLANEITTYYQSNAILKSNGTIYIPYKYILPFNVTFNWSLQNLSSYYTDIGIIWFLGLGIVLL